MDNDKPISLSMREFLVRKMAAKLMLSERTIDAVIVHQFQSANEALASNDEVEVSGFGKFIYNKGKALKTLVRYKAYIAAYQKQLLRPEITDAQRRTLGLKMTGISQEIDIITNKLKLNETVTDIRGMEEQVDSSQSSETDHSVNQ